MKQKSTRFVKYLIATKMMEIQGDNKLLDQWKDNPEDRLKDVVRSQLENHEREFYTLMNVLRLENPERFKKHWADIIKKVKLKENEKK